MAWDYLQEGDIVDLIAPGYGIKPKDIEPCEAYIRSLGLIPRIPSDLLGKHIFSSNQDEHRLKHLTEAIYAEDSKAIWCLKGGHGTAHLIPHLNNLPQPKQQKLLIGFSDITALHLFVTQKWDWSTVHGSVLWQLMKERVNKDSVTLLHDLIFGRNEKQKFKLFPLNNISQDVIHGKVTGGNLMLIQSSIATCWQIHAQGNIVFIEDIDERAYRVDRMLTHLQQANIFKDAQAIIFGDFIYKDIEDQEKNIAIVEQNFANHINIPVYKIKGIGHGKTNHPLPLGTKSIINPMNNLLTCNNK